MTASHRVGLLVSAAILCLGASQARAQQQILSAITTDPGNDPEIDRVSTNAGTLVSYSDANSNGRVLTDYGVNKVFSTANGTHDQTASSAWLDTYTAQGPAGSKVRMSLSFSFDGTAAFGPGQVGDNAPEYGFKVVAMRGGGWTMAAIDDARPGGPYDARFASRGYDTLFLQRVGAQGGIEQLDMSEAPAMLNFVNAGGGPGNFNGKVTHVEEQDLYKIVSRNPNNGMMIGNYFYDTFYRSGTPDTPLSGPIFYDAGTPLATNLGVARNNLENNFSILDTASLCDEGDTCIDRVWEPTALTLDFEVMAGQSFTLAAWMYADSVDNGSRIDFFNTAKFTGLTATTEAGEAVTITSASGALVAKPGGGYGYIAAGIPEPATWAMMILGMGAVGATMRRRQTSTVVTYA